MSGIKKETGVGKFSCTYINVGIVSVYNVDMCCNAILPGFNNTSSFHMCGVSYVTSFSVVPTGEY